MEPQATLHVGVEIVVSPARIADPKVRGPALQIPIQFLNQDRERFKAKPTAGHFPQLFPVLSSEPSSTGSYSGSDASGRVGPGRTEMCIPENPRWLPSVSDRRCAFSPGLVPIPSTVPVSIR